MSNNYSATTPPIHNSHLHTDLLRRKLARVFPNTDLEAKIKECSDVELIKNQLRLGKSMHGEVVKLVIVPEHTDQVTGKTRPLFVGLQINNRMVDFTRSGIVWIDRLRVKHYAIVVDVLNGHTTGITAVRFKLSLSTYPPSYTFRRFVKQSKSSI